MSTDRLTALVMCAGSMPGVAVINALKRQDELPVRVVAADASPLAAGFHLADASATVPYANTEAFLPTVLDICRREGVGLVFPIIDEELLVFAEARDRFAAEGIRVITNDPDVVATARDKYKTYEFCRREGIAVPETYLPGDLPDDLDVPAASSSRGTAGARSACRSVLATAPSWTSSWPGRRTR